MPPHDPASPPGDSGRADARWDAHKEGSVQDPLLAAAGTSSARVAFVSRSAPIAAREPELPGLGDPWLRLVLCMALLLQALSWWRLEGYQLADSVEYLERAQAFVRGEEVLDSTSIRSFAFSALLAPFFAIADWVGADNYRPVVSLARLLQMGFGLALVWRCARIGALFAGRSAGLASAFFVASNPVFLQYSVSPVSGVAAAFATASGIEALIVPGSSRRRLRGALWLGAALTLAYQTLLVSVPLGLLVILRDRRERLAAVAPLCAGFGAGVLLQVVLDKLIYGVWGASLWRHFVSHAGPYGALFLSRLGFDEPARQLYDAAQQAIDAKEAASAVTAGSTLADIERLLPADWYFRNITSMLVWPVLLFLLLGLVVAWRRARWSSSIALLVLALNLWVMSDKGSKDFRLWLPLLPLLAPLAGSGFELATRAQTGRGVGGGGRSGMRSALAVLLLLVVPALGVQTLLARNTRRFSGYWEAMEEVLADVGERRGAAIERGEPAPTFRVASAYHWAVYLREDEGAQLIKLPKHLDHWEKYDAQERAQDLAAIASMDYFITHLAVLSSRPELMAAVNRDFELQALLWDRDVFEDIGAVCVLKRRSGDPRARTFFDITRGESAEAYARRHHFEAPQRFVRRLGQHLELITLLGWTFEELPGDDHGWITYHWHCGSEIRGDYTVVDRLTTFDERNTWQNDHAPAYGVARTHTWQPGDIVRESWPVIAAADPYNWRTPYRPMGGPYRRGDLMPANLWMALFTFGADGAVTGRMHPARAGSDEPMLDAPVEEAMWTPDGYRFSKDGLIRVGRFLLPVHESARLADDGRVLD